MPWGIPDVERHKKGLSSAQKSRWAGIANKVLQQTGNEGRAIRIANGITRSAVDRRLKKSRQTGVGGFS